jgi:S1-C subfamily serine protease
MQLKSLSVILIAIMLSSCASIQRFSSGWEDVAKRTISATVLIESEIQYIDSEGNLQAGKGIGSGAVISSDGFILTNAHVIMKEAIAEVITVRFANGAAYRVANVWAFKNVDLAVLKINTHDLPYIKIRKEQVEVGESCLAIGNPIPYQFVVKEGIISQTTWTPYSGPERLDLLVSSASILPGNSGGPLVDSKGSLIGLSVAYIPMKALYALHITVATILPALDIVSKLTGHRIYGWAK